ncbi:MAG TPA: hypothetical protein VGQ83_18365 [Polyangia bacterium]|jgi:hypothetical protein
MGLGGTLLIYGLLGAVVATAMALRQPHRGGWRIVPAALAWAACWPLFAPLLLGRAPAPAPDGAPDGDPRLRRAEDRLRAALAALAANGGLLQPEVARLERVGGVLGALTRRREEMARLLASPEFDEAEARAALAALAARGRDDRDPHVQSVRARLRNIARLRAMHERTRDHLERATSRMEEMSSQLLVLRFADGGEREAVELVQEIAASVEGIAEGLTAGV